MQIIVAFLLKLIDNALSTVKTIFLQKERYFLGAMFNALSTFFYLIAIVQIAKSNNLFSIVAMCIATFLGTYLPGILIKKSEREKLYIYDITANEFNAGKEFADEVRNTNIAIKSYVSYDDELNKVLSCKVYCTTRKESIVINNLIPDTFKYHIYVPIED